MTAQELIKELSIWKDELEVYVRIDDKDIEGKVTDIEVTQSGAIVINATAG